jgi:hypothetical protein
MLRIRSLLVLAPFAFAAPPLAAEEGYAIRRCTSPDGSIVYTDRACASFNATDRLPPPASRDRAHGGHAVVSSKGVQSAGTRPECPGSPSALVSSLGAAWQSRDVNRVAGLVDWRGTGSGTAHRVLRHLRSALGEQALDIALEAPPVYASVADPYGGATTNVAVAGAEPTNVRVDHEGDSTRFGLRRDLGCFWLDVASLD